ncbi:MAG: 50S ribosomal protein L21e [Candidatus Aenigmarchaeota archaeon]|nr:50S ribosomal protein L21e [Candidatus Aenigmarchaeota archaeon]
MVRKSYGKMRGTRKKKFGGDLPVNRYLEEFKPGDNVSIKLHAGLKFPHPRFHGTFGTVIAKRGRAYLVRVKDINAYKDIFLKPEHLKKGN